jgi:hypothetical protein
MVIRASDTEQVHRPEKDQGKHRPAKDWVASLFITVSAVRAWLFWGLMDLANRLLVT